jgi:hypothetical protein
MELYQECLGGLDELVEALREAGLSEVVFRSPRGSLVLRGEDSGGVVEEAGGGALGAGTGAAGDDPARLVLLRSHCVGRWNRACESGTGTVVDRDARLGTISTLLGEEGLRAPGPGRVEKWIIGEGEVAGFGDPLALFREVF